MDKIIEFTANHPWLVAGLIGSFLWVMFYELKQKAAGLVNVDTATAVSLINDGAMVIDLRSNEAFGQGHIVNAKNIPLDEFEARREAVIGSKPRSIVAVCDSGARSARAIHSLRQSGNESAFNLKGGMTAWTQAGLPVVTGKKTKSKDKG
jgi:rhodanese-related sulfurtransferase